MGLNSNETGLWPKEGVGRYAPEILIGDFEDHSLWAALDPVLERGVLVQIYPYTGHAQREAALNRVRGARASLRFTHPSTCAVLDADSLKDGGVYIVTEACPPAWGSRDGAHRRLGPSIEHALSQGLLRVSPHDAAVLTLELCDALIGASRLGLALPEMSLEGVRVSVRDDALGGSLPRLRILGVFARSHSIDAPASLDQQNARNCALVFQRILECWTSRHVGKRASSMLPAEFSRVAAHTYNSPTELAKKLRQIVQGYSADRVDAVERSHSWAVGSSLLSFGVWTLLLFLGVVLGDELQALGPLPAVVGLVLMGVVGINIGLLIHRLGYAVGGAIVAAIGAALPFVGTLVGLSVVLATRRSVRRVANTRLP